MSVAQKVFENMVSELTELGKSDLAHNVFARMVSELVQKG